MANPYAAKSSKMLPAFLLRSEILFRPESIPESVSAVLCPSTKGLFNLG